MNLFESPKMKKRISQINIDKLCAKGGSDYNQMLKDIPRTTIPLFLTKFQSEKYMDSVLRVLLCYSNYEKSVGYVQGMNIIASYLINLMCDDFDCISDCEKDVFGIFLVIFEGYDVGSYYTNKMAKVLKIYKELENEIEKKHTEIYSHILKLDVDLLAKCHELLLGFFFRFWAQYGSN